ncbi:MAG: ABC transporter ATP-binding protein [Candidatus Bathyarchaeia archaeon]|nr:ABC transporter ATP-binding protein [Candidatus Bathyarchaeota archaeon]
MVYAIEIKNLTKVYNGEVKALDKVNLVIEAGKVFALLGPNGAGKTTLIRILTTQLKPTYGEAYIFGLNVSSESSKVKRLIGYIPQEVCVWSDISGYENLLFYAKLYGVSKSERKNIINEVLEKMGLSKVANNLVKTYSGGMVRRLEIACALLTKPKILFLDEPTIGLDPSARKTVWEELTFFKKEYGSTIFFSTHYMDEAEFYADEIAIINNGRIVKTGTVEELKRSIKGEVISLTFEGNILNCLDKIKMLNLVNDVSVNNSELIISSEKAESILLSIIEILKTNNIQIKKLSINKPSLDNVFLKYASVKIESSGKINDVAQIRKMIVKR